MKRFYRKLSSIIQNRKNELLRISSSIQSFSIQLSSSSQAFSSFSSSVIIISIISSTQNRISYESRTQYESDTRQNRYTNIRNLELRHEDRSFNSESRYENRYDRESNRLRNRQYEFSEYALTRYEDENLRSMNEIRRSSQSDHQTSVNQAFESYVSSSFESYVSSSSKITYKKEISMLNKLYKNEKKFESTENNFDFKLTIYLDKCRHADLSAHAYEKEISVMLTDKTLTRYYANKTNFITFNDFCISMQTYFENSK
jgi:hypothetical protein